MANFQCHFLGPLQLRLTCLLTVLWARVEFHRDLRDGGSLERKPMDTNVLRRRRAAPLAGPADSARPYDQSSVRIFRAVTPALSAGAAGAAGAAGLGAAAGAPATRFAPACFGSVFIAAPFRVASMDVSTFAALAPGSVLGCGGMMTGADAVGSGAALAAGATLGSSTLGPGVGARLTSEATGPAGATETRLGEPPK